MYAPQPERQTDRTTHDAKPFPCMSMTGILITIHGTYRYEQVVQDENFPRYPVYLSHHTVRRRMGGEDGRSIRKCSW